MYPFWIQWVTDKLNVWTSLSKQKYAENLNKFSWIGTKWGPYLPQNSLKFLMDFKILCSKYLIIYLCNCKRFSFILLKTSFYKI